MDTFRDEQITRNFEELERKLNMLLDYLDLEIVPAGETIRKKTPPTP